jgi:hypothetical protein
MGTRANRNGYWSLAAAVLASAIRDLHLVTEGSRVRRQSARHHSSAQRLFHDTTSPRLQLWCAWLDLDPAVVCAVVTSDEAPRMITHRMDDLMRRSR